MSSALSITAVEVRLEQGRVGPYVQIEERWYCITTRPWMLDLGVATLFPMMAESSGKLEDDWQCASRFSAVVAADPTAGRMAPLEFSDATNDSLVLDFARLYEEGARHGQIRLGPLDVSCLGNPLRDTP